jgi:hypothetical protein
VRQAADPELPDRTAEVRARGEKIATLFAEIIADDEPIRLVVPFEVAAEEAASGKVGQGPLSAAFSVLRGLQRLGWKGKIEIVYHHDPHTLPFLQNTFPRIGTAESHKLGDNTLVYVKYGSPAHTDVQRTVTVVGELDGATLGHGIYELTTQSWFPTQQVCAKTKYAVILQPFGWFQDRGIIDSIAKEIDVLSLGEEPGTTPLAKYRNIMHNQEADPPLPRFANFFKAWVEVTDVDAFVEKHKAKTDKNEVATLKALLSRAQSGQVELLASYGLHANTGSSAPASLRRIACAAKYATFNDPNHKALPVVIYNVRGPQPTEWTREKFTTLDATDTTAPQVIENAQPHDVIILTSKGLPGALFDTLYEMSSYPVIFEGANTAGLCYREGIPFVMTRDNAQLFDLHFEHDGVESSRCPLRRLACAAGAKCPTTSLFSDVLGPQDEWENVLALAQAFIDSRDPTTELFKWYKTAYIQASDKRNEQLAVALARVADRMKNNAS